MPKLVAGRGEVAAPVAAAVVGQDPLDRDPVARVEAPGALEEGGRRRRRLVGQLLGVGQPAVVVDREVDPVPADAAVPVALTAGDPMTAARSDPAEHLGVEVDEFARPLALVADDWWPGLEPVEPAQALAPQDRVDRSAGEPGLPGEDVRADPQLAPPGAQAIDELGRMPTGLAVDGARAVAQRPGPGAAPPLRTGLAADPRGSGRRRDRPAGRDAIDQERRPCGVRRALGCDMRVPSFDCGLQHQQPNDRGPQPVNNLIGN